MSRKILGGYAAAVFFSVFLVLWIALNTDNTPVYRLPQGTAGTLAPVSQTAETDGSQTYTLALPANAQGGFDLVFFSNHQQVTVCYNGVQEYSLTAPGGLFGKTTGSVWNFVPLSPSGTAGTATVTLRALYPDIALCAPTFYYGPPGQILSQLLLRSLFPLGVCFLIVMIGLSLLVYWFSIVRHVGAGGTRRLLYLGFLSLLLGLWAANETDAATLLLPNRPAAVPAAFLLLFLMPIPFILHVKESFQVQHTALWRGLCLFNLGCLLVSSTLQLTGLADFRETAILSHISLLTALFYLVYILRRRFRQKRVDHGLWLHVAGLFILAAGLLCDLFSYYLNGVHTDYFGSLCFLIYVALLATQGISEANQAIKQGKVAEVYRQMAMYDSLTDMLSRAAYDHDLHTIYQCSENHAVVVFDLNDLKLHNDLYGHQAGDRALRRAASLIRKIYSPYGRCYRIGGDEFCAVLPRSRPEALDALLESLRLAEDAENARAPGPMPLRVACGYALYDPLEDTTLEDTRLRADLLLYKNKQLLKRATL